MEEYMRAREELWSSVANDYDRPLQVARKGVEVHCGATVTPEVELPPDVVVSEVVCIGQSSPPQQLYNCTVECGPYTFHGAIVWPCGDDKPRPDHLTEEACRRAVRYAAYEFLQKSPPADKCLP